MAKYTALTPTEEELELLKALKDCKLKDGKLTVPSAYSNKVEEISNFLREAIYGYAVPHYRVVAIKVYGANRVDSNYVTFLSKLYGIDASYHDLMTRVKDLIFAKCGRPVFNYMQECGLAASTDLSQCGMIYGIGHMNTTNESQGFMYAKDGEELEVRALVPDLYIGTTDTSTGVYFLLERGWGEKDFTDNQKYCRKGAFIPLRAVYDLSEIISVGVYQDGDQYVRMIYSRHIREEILEDIIHGFADDYV